MNFLPAIRGMVIDFFVQIKFKITDHLRLFSHAIGHPFSLVRLQHIHVEIDVQELANFFGENFRLIDQVFKSQAILTLCRNFFQKFQDILMANEPDQFRQFTSCEGIFIAKEILVQLCLKERIHRGVRMSGQMNVLCIFKVGFRPF